MYEYFADNYLLYIKYISILISVFFIPRLSKIISNAFIKIIQYKDINQTALEFIKRVIFILVFLSLILIILENLGIETTSIFALLGAASLAIGLALKNSLDNVASSIVILINKPFLLDDFIEANSHSGTVIEINFFSTKIKTLDQKIITIPNATLINSSITNFSVSKIRRLDLVISISYEANIKKVKDVLMQSIESEKLVLAEYDVTIGINELNESSIDYVIRCFVKREDYFTLKFKLYETIKNNLDKNNIEIPFNKLDVNLKTLK